MVNLTIFQDVNFIYDLRMYAIIEVARSRFSLTLVSPSMGQLGTPLHSNTKSIFGKENSTVIHLLSSTLRRHMFVLLCLLALTSLSSSLLAIPPTYIFFLLLSEPTLYLSLGRYRRPLRRGLLARGQFY